MCRPAKATWKHPGYYLIISCLHFVSENELWSYTHVTVGTHTHTKQTCTSSTGQGPLHLLVHTHITDVHILHGPGASTLVGAHIHKTERAHPPRARGLHKQETGKCSVSAQWSMRWPGLGRDMTIRKSDLYFTSFVQCSLQHSWETLRILPLS